MKAILFAALTLFGAAVVLAQSADQNETERNDAEQSPEQFAQIDTAPELSPAPAYVPLTLKQKYVFSMEEIFGVNRLVGLAVHAGLDQAGIRPVQWGSHPESLAIRFASKFGDSLIRHNIEFGVRALDHEDPRYFRMGHGRALARARYAVVHTFVVHNDRGGWMPAYSLIATDYGTPYLVRRWRPERFHTASTLDAGTLSVGIGMGSNLLREFWPDIKSKLPNRLAHSPLLGRD
jgi:hypothetical protein